MFVKRPYNPEGDELSGRTVAIIFIIIVLALLVGSWLQHGGRVAPAPQSSQQGEVE